MVDELNKTIHQAKCYAFLIKLERYSCIVVSFVITYLKRTCVCTELQ